MLMFINVSDGFNSRYTPFIYPSWESYFGHNPLGIITVHILHDWHNSAWKLGMIHNVRKQTIPSDELVKTRRDLSVGEGTHLRTPSMGCSVLHARQARRRDTCNQLGTSWCTWGWGHCRWPGKARRIRWSAAQVDILTLEGKRARMQQGLNQWATRFWHSIPTVPVKTKKVLTSNS